MVDRIAIGKEIDSEKGDSNAATVIQRNKERRSVVAPWAFSAISRHA
jgi:hypothetical protein